jgi:hypothetical protein
MVPPTVCDKQGSGWLSECLIIHGLHTGASRIDIELYVYRISNSVLSIKGYLVGVDVSGMSSGGSRRVRRLSWSDIWHPDRSHVKTAVVVAVIGVVLTAVTSFWLWERARQEAEVGLATAGIRRARR